MDRVGEEPVAAPDAERPDGIFLDVVVDAEAAVLDVALELAPLRREVVQRLPQQALLLEEVALSCMTVIPSLRCPATTLSQAAARRAGVGGAQCMFVPEQLFGRGVIHFGSYYAGTSSTQGQATGPTSLGSRLASGLTTHCRHHARRPGEDVRVENHCAQAGVLAGAPATRSSGWGPPLLGD